MANLLTKASEKRLRRAQRARLLLLLAYSVFGVSLGIVCALVPASIALYYGTRSASDTVGAAPPTAQDRAAYQEVREIVFALKPLAAATTTPTEAILSALTLKPSSISIDHISYQAGGAVGTIALSGVSLEPSALNAYRAAISADPHVVNASVPVGALIGADNGRFTMTIMGRF